MFHVEVLIGQIALTICERYETSISVLTSEWETSCSTVRCVQLQEFKLKCPGCLATGETNHPRKDLRFPHHLLKAVVAEVAMIKARKRLWKHTGLIPLLWKEQLKLQKILKDLVSITVL